MKKLYLIAPILSIALFFCVYLLISENKRSIPQYDSLEVADWSYEDYYKHLKNKPFRAREVHKLLIKRTKQKPGVYLESLEEAMDTAGLEMVNIYHQVLGDDYIPVITSGNDWPYHLRNSKHYQNKAMDFRIKYIPYGKKKEIVEKAKAKLSSRFKVLWEKGDSEHLHIEMKD